MIPVMMQSQTDTHEQRRIRYNDLQRRQTELEAIISRNQHDGELVAPFRKEYRENADEIQKILETNIQESEVKP